MVWLRELTFTTLLILLSLLLRRRVAAENDSSFACSTIAKRSRTRIRIKSKQNLTTNNVGIE